MTDKEFNDSLTKAFNDAGVIPPQYRDECMITTVHGDTPRGRLCNIRLKFRGSHRDCGMLIDDLPYSQLSEQLRVMWILVFETGRLQ